MVNFSPSSGSIEIWRFTDFYPLFWYPTGHNNPILRYTVATTKESHKKHPLFRWDSTEMNDHSVLRYIVIFWNGAIIMSGRITSETNWIEAYMNQLVFLKAING